MNRYWDLTPQQRARLTRDQVMALLDVELMEKGVAKVGPPELVPVPRTDLSGAEFFEVQFIGSYGSPDSSGFVFETAEQAKQFIDAKPLKRDSDYRFGSLPYAKKATGAKIVPVELPNEQAVMAAAAILSEAEEAKKANRVATDAHSKAQTEVKEALSGLWEDWHDKRAQEADAQEVQRTRREYIELCEGNEETAETFLRKAHDADRIRAADEWLGEEVAATQ